MKVIDLLNKLYNMEETPEKIKIGCSYLTLNENKDNYIYEDSDEYYGDKLIHWYSLDEKVEVIKDKKIEKLTHNISDYGNEYLYEEVKDKINEIIDYLEENK